MHHLQQLNSELDVSQSPAAQLELTFGMVGRHVPLDAAPHLLNLGDEVLPVGRRPDKWRDYFRVLPAEFGIASNRPRLQQRLELPGLGPFLVVPLMTFEGANQRAGLALRAKCGIDLETCFSSDSHHCAGQPCRRGEITSTDEDDVDVADIVEFPATAFPHGDDRESAFGRYT